MNSFKSTEIYNELYTILNIYINDKKSKNINNYCIEDNYCNFYISADNSKLKKMIEKDIFSIIAYITYNYNKEYNENLPTDSITDKDTILYILTYYINKEIIYEHKNKYSSKKFV